MKYESAQQLAEKIEWEGGLSEFLFGYGCSHADLPEDLPGYVYRAFLHINNAQVHTAYQVIEEWLEDQNEPRS